MKKHTQHTICAALLLGSLAPALEANVVTGEAMLNPFFSSGDYANWSLGGWWREDGTNDRLVFDVLDTNVAGFSLAAGTGVDLSTEDAITANPNYTGPDSAFLIGFTFGEPFLAPINEGSIGASADYNLFFEVDVTTAAGTYRAQSTAFNNAWELGSGSISPTFSWLTEGGFLGDPANAAGGNGIVISAIEAIQYKAVMQIITPTDNGTGPGFQTVNNMSLIYQVAVIPEPSTSAACGIGVFGVVLLLRRRQVIIRKSM